jgi:hypothetical protein
MVIDCAQCEFRRVACGDCLVTVLMENGADGKARNRHGKDNRRSGAGVGPGRRALGAQDLRALSALAAAGMVPPLRYRPAQVSGLEAAIVAL